MGPRDRQRDRAGLWRTPLLWAIALSLALHFVLMGRLGWRLPVEEEPLTFHARFLRRAQVEPAAAHAARTNAAPARVPAARTSPPERMARALQSVPVPNEPVPSPAMPAPAETGDKKIEHTQDEDNVTPLEYKADDKPREPLPQQETTQERAAGNKNPGQARADESERLSARGPTVSAQTFNQWPQHGRIGYRVYYGDSQVWAGEAEQVWQHTAHDYEVRLDLRSIGFARLIRAFDLTWLAHGRLVDGQMVSDGFRDERNKKVCESKVDLARGVVMQVRRGEKREISIDGAALDVLSMIHFTSMQLDGEGEGFGVFIDGGCWVSAAQVAALGEESITLPVGELPARHYRSVQNDGAMIVDFWMAKKWQGAPIRIRIDDRKQKHLFDLQAAEVELDGKILARAPRTR